MPTGTIDSSISVGGLEFSSKASKTANGQVGQIVALIAAAPGLKSALGVNTMTTGHGIIGGDVVDVQWTDPADGTHKARRAVTVDIANANDITFDETPAAVGDAYPANATAVTVHKRINVDTDFDGDLVEMIAVKSTGRCVVDFRDVSGVVLLSQKLAADQAFTWINGQGVANPLTGNPVDHIKVSSGLAAATTFSLGLIYRS